ncbi:MAG: hypothetical protein AAFQ95_08690 [Cyanobacteria bacterium J06621_3]
MVSPLRIWQHSEPKGFWPALGGLAVVAHVGVIGLSLPYVAGLVGGEGGSASAVVAVELIVSTDTEPNPDETTESARGDDTPANEQSTQPLESTTPVAPSPPVRQSPASVVETSAGETPSEPPSQQPLPAEQARQDNESPVAAESPSKNEVPSEEAPDERASEAQTGQNEEPAVEKDAETTSPEEMPSNEAGALPVLGGEQLPSPGDVSTGEGVAQFTALSFTGYDYVPDNLRQDRVARTFPEPDQTSAITVRPKDVACEEVSELPSTPLTYRVTISESGSIEEARPWTGRIEVARSLSESESAIECLLRRSNWRFTPALDEDGKAYPFSDVLLTFTLNLESD